MYEILQAASKIRYAILDYYKDEDLTLYNLLHRYAKELKLLKRV